MLENDLSVWDVETRRKCSAPGEMPESIWGFACSRDAELLALGTESGISIRNLAAAGAEVHQIDDVIPIFWEAPQMAFSPDGKLFLFADHWHDSLSILDTRSWDVRFKFGDKNGGIRSAAFSDDSRFAVLATSQTIQLVDLATGEARAIPTTGANAGAGHHFQVVFFPGGTMLAAAGTYGVQLISIDSGSVIGRIPSPVQCVAVSPSGQTIATGDSRGIVTFWNASTMAKLRLVSVNGRYRIPWTAPATLLGTWILLHWILMRRGLFLKNAH